MTVVIAASSGSARRPSSPALPDPRLTRGPSVLLHRNHLTFPLLSRLFPVGRGILPELVPVHRATEFEEEAEPGVPEWALKHYLSMDALVEAVETPNTQHPRH